MSRTRAFVAAIASIGAAGGIWAWSVSVPVEQPSSETRSTAGAVPEPALPPVNLGASPKTSRERCVFEGGEKLAYAVVARSSSRFVSLEGRDDQAPTMDFSLNLSGSLAFEVLRGGPAGAVLVGKLEDLRVDASTPTEALTQPFLVELAPDCRLIRFARWNQAPLMGARNQQALLWESQWRLPTGKEAFSGEDGLGRFSGALTSRETEAGLQVERTIGAYATLWRSDERQVEASGVMTVELGAGPWFTALVSTQRIASPGTVVDSRLELTARDASAIRFGEDARDTSRYTWQNLLPLRSPQHAPRPVTEADLLRREAVKHQTVTEALQGLTTRATTAGLGMQEHWPDLAAWFEANPSQIASAVEKLRTGELSNDQARMSFHIALGNARVPEAKVALLEIKRNPHAPPIERMRAIFSLIDREDVSTPFAQELASDATPLASASTRAERFMPAESLLALSTMSGRRADAELSAIAADSVRQALTSRDEASVRVALKGLANTGDPSLLVDAKPFTTHPDPAMREAAASVFRRMPTRETDLSAVSWLSREQHPFVKGQLYRVIRSQHFDAHQPASRELVNQALADLVTSKSEITRKHIIRLVASSEAANEPGIRAALVRQARWEHEKDTGLINEFTDVLTPEETWEVLR